MEEIKEILIFIAEIIDFVAVIIMIFGVIKVLVKYLLSEVKNLTKVPIQSIQQIRCELGVYILLALDLLIASDIVHTISVLDQEQLIALGVMILLRTGIGYFLGKEITEIEEANLKS